MTAMTHTVVSTHGPGLDRTGMPWAVHGAVMVEQWLSDFFWKSTPLDHFVTGVDVVFQDGPATPLWRSKAPGRALPAGPSLKDLPPLDEAFYNMWHPLWYELVDTWHLTGTWLHPRPPTASTSSPSPSSGPTSTSAATTGRTPQGPGGTTQASTPSPTIRV